MNYEYGTKTWFFSNKQPKLLSIIKTRISCEKSQLISDISLNKITQNSILDFSKVIFVAYSKNYAQHFKQIRNCQFSCCSVESVQKEVRWSPVQVQQRPAEIRSWQENFCQLFLISSFEHSVVKCPYFSLHVSKTLISQFSNPRFSFRPCWHGYELSQFAVSTKVKEVLYLQLEFVPEIQMISIAKKL